MYFNKLISVIVPVYNVEEYLEECLDSIQCQTYKNIEVILVNDGSQIHLKIFVRNIVKKIIALSCFANQIKD